MRREVFHATKQVQAPIEMHRGSMWYVARLASATAGSDWEVRMGRARGGCIFSGLTGRRTGLDLVGGRKVSGRMFKDALACSFVGILY